MQGINKEIAEKYYLDVKSVTPFKDFYVVHTSKGKKFLRKTIFQPERILFIHGAKEHLFKKNFKNLDRFLCTFDDSPFINFEGSCYTLTDAIEGRECNFENREEVVKAANLLASMHKASKGYVPDIRSKPQDDLGMLPSYFSKRLDEIRKLKKIAKKGKSRFDYLFLDYADYFYRLGEVTLQQISDSRYERLVNEVRKEGSFCHHDFTHHNVICSDSRCIIVNFNYCCFELKVYDIANFLRRKMRKCGWSIEEAKVIMDEYRTVEPLSDDELFTMKLILQFPQKFWRVANKYYNSRRSWSEKSYVAKLHEVIEEIEPHKKFIERYEELV